MESVSFNLKCNLRVRFSLKKTLKPDFHLKIVSREILHSSNLIGFAQFSAKKVKNISTFFNFARNTTIENGPIFKFRITFLSGNPALCSNLCLLFIQSNEKLTKKSRLVVIEACWKVYSILHYFRFYIIGIRLYIITRIFYNIFD